MRPAFLLIELVFPCLRSATGLGGRRSRGIGVFIALLLVPGARVAFFAAARGEGEAAEQEGRQETPENRSGDGHGESVRWC